MSVDIDEPGHENSVLDVVYTVTRILLDYSFSSTRSDYSSAVEYDSSAIYGQLIIP